MPNAGPQGGWGAGANTAPPNPFSVATTPSPANPFTKPTSNPFSQNNKGNQAPANNPFGVSATNANPFSTAAPLRRSASPSFNQAAKTTIHNPFASAKQEVSNNNSQSFKPPTARRSSPGTTTNGSRKVAEFVQPAWSSGSNAPTVRIPDFTNSNNRRGGISAHSNGQTTRRSAVPMGTSGRQRLASGLGSDSQGTHDGRSREFSSKIQQQLSRDRITPPQWPANPGSHVQRQAMETFRESYKAYREKARKSLIRAGLIDDPNKRRTLQQALDFRGISEEMCPEWEKITRIIEYDIRNPEKAPDDTGDLVAMPSLMVKRLARSAAGQDAPLPMDVRSFAALRKTLNYLIDDLIPDDSFLPSRHNFLWDRTRAIRIDLSVQKYNLTPDERKDLVYCLETIARFHVTALHLLSQEGFAAEDFSEQQEIEQLGKTLISLKELYDDCVAQNIECANEAEFRGYYIVFNARNPSIKETVEGWPARLWNTDGIRTAMCLVESLQNTWSLQGPLNPYAPTELALGAASIFFSIVASPQISYTMACFAEIHFNDVRKSILHIIRKSYTRPRDGPKDITPTFLRERMRFDTEDEAVDFAQKHGIVFSQEGAHRYAVLNSRGQPIEDPRVRHAFSRDIVERKRSGRSLPDIIHRTVFEGSSEPSPSQEESLFVAEVENNAPSDTSDGVIHASETPGFSSTTPASSSTITNSQPPNKTTSIWQRPHGPITSPSQQPGQPSKFPATSTPRVTLSKPVVTLDSKFQTTNPPPVSSLDFDKKPQLNGDSSSPRNNTSENVFSFLNSNNKAALTSETSGLPQPVSISGDSQPSVSSGTGTASRLLAAIKIKPPSTLSSDSIEPPYPSFSQGHSISSGQFSFKRATSTVYSGSNGSVLDVNHSSSSPLPKTKPISPPTEQSGNPTESGPSDAVLSSKSGLAQEQSDTVHAAPSPTATIAMAPRRDPMEDFTRWFVLADKGTMEAELEALAVEHVLGATWKDFQVAEEDRIRKEEDEKSWAEALQFRRYSLKVTYFYRWRDLTRKRRVIKRIRIEKEKARKWKSPQSAAERESAKALKQQLSIQEAKELVEKRTRQHTQEKMRMRESTQSRQSLEEVLLATGVFNGVRDERAAAHHAAQNDNVDSEGDILPAEKLRIRSENQRRRKRGLPPLKRFPESQNFKEGSKTAMLRAISSGSGRDSLSLSTSSLRNSTFSSSYRSSLGFNQSRVAKSRTTISDPYWRMKANGLVQMPNGEYLHESLALPMLREGKRFPGLGDYGLPPIESFTPSQSPPAEPNLEPGSSSPTPARSPRDERASRSPSLNGGAMQKRKRGQAEDDDLAMYRNEAPAGRKRAKSSDRVALTGPSPDQDFLDSIANLLDQVNAVTTSSTS
ncbi:hypothetical protein F5Y03DRAFT_355537 [Xylaria venustula]|nr:hypothetical protein F5Y03DRAFT_355537 [Xylaria venustula]